METRVYRKIAEPIRKGLSQDDAWNKPDKGLIKCWEVGRTLAETDPELAERARKNELPVLGWKGGVAEAIKKKHKFGTLNYLAKWQGLRGDNLDVDLASEREHVCSRTGLRVTFTRDSDKFKEP